MAKPKMATPDPHAQSSNMAKNCDQDPRVRLLKAAERCFIASGFHGARMAQIAKEARMSPGHIYHYFESKEAIIAELVRIHAQEKHDLIVRYETAGERILAVMVENLSDNICTSTDPFWSALMLEITAEATRNPVIADMLRTADSEKSARILTCLANELDVDRLDSRLEIVIALIQGLAIRNIVNPKLNKPAIRELLAGIIPMLFSKAT